MNVELPDNERCGKALNFLSHSDDSYARACAAYKAAESEVKMQREVAFLEADGTQGERAAKANSSGTVRLASKKLEEAYYEKTLLEARRDTATMIIDVWRSLNSNRRAGIV